MNLYKFILFNKVEWLDEGHYGNSAISNLIHKKIYSPSCTNSLGMSSLNVVNKIILRVLYEIVKVASLEQNSLSKKYKFGIPTKNSLDQQENVSYF